jgi:hypothetical protein
MGLRRTRGEEISMWKIAKALKTFLTDRELLFLIGELTKQVEDQPRRIMRKT